MNEKRLSEIEAFCEEATDNCDVAAHARVDVPDLCAAVRSARKLARVLQMSLYHYPSSWSDSERAELEELLGFVPYKPDEGVYRARKLADEVMR